MIEEPFDKVLAQICSRISENFTKSKFVINTRINRTVISRNMLMSDQELPGQSDLCPGCGWSEKKVFQCNPIYIDG